MEFDLVVRNGTVIDGSGAPRQRADVAVVGDRIVEVGSVEGAGKQELDAGGLVVAPGFIDGHTHMDAQVFWDELGMSSCWHGVTTVVMGNCGFTLAPTRDDVHELTVSNLERSEDIPGEALARGIAWTWTTFSQYLDAVDARTKGINYAASIGHSALRTWAMGERAFEGPASEDDLAIMKAELRDALHAGAVGFTTSQSDQHLTPDGRRVASRLADWSEVVALVELVGRESSGTFQLAKGAADLDPEARASYFMRIQELALATGVPIVSGIFGNTRSTPWVDLMDKAAARGGQVFGLTNCRGVGHIQSFQTRLAFDALPEWREVRAKPFEEQRVLLRDPDVRTRLVHSAYEGRYPHAAGVEPRKPDFDLMTVMYSPFLPNPTLADEARQRGLDPVEAMIDIALENDFEVFFTTVRNTQDEDELVKMMRHPLSAMTFSDSGAHVSQITDASIQSHLLAYWVREREMFSLEEAIRMVTLQPARVWRLHDRGRLTPGFAADLTIFDPHTVAPLMPKVVHDLPGGLKRLEQRADGYAATVVNGQIFTRDGEPTDVRAGRLLRATGASA